MSAAQYPQCTFVKSSRSANNGACVEVALDPGAVLVRDSKDGRSPVLHFGATSWVRFLTSVRAGAFDAGA